jgi:hypothetical protein
LNNCCGFTLKRFIFASVSQPHSAVPFSSYLIARFTARMEIVLLCPLCRREDLFYDHLMLAWRCQDCKKYFQYDEKDKTLRAIGSSTNFSLC